MLDAHHFIDTIFLCTDNDPAGHETAKRIGAELTQRNNYWERLVSESKDWNDDQRVLKGLEQEKDLKMSM